MTKTPTELLQASVRGDRLAASELLPLVYDELRALAARLMRAEKGDHTLEPTALVHEAYLRLIQIDQMEWNGRTHFFAMAATTLRRVLVDAARARAAEKKGGRQQRITLSDDLELTEIPLDVLALDDALTQFREQYPRRCDVVELRYFAGLSVEETAQSLGVSPGTVKADWRFARAWLHKHMGGAPES